MGVRTQKRELLQKRPSIARWQRGINGTGFFEQGDHDRAILAVSKTRRGFVEADLTIDPVDEKSRVLGNHSRAARELHINGTGLREVNGRARVLETPRREPARVVNRKTKSSTSFCWFPVAAAERITRLLWMTSRRSNGAADEASACTRSLRAFLSFQQIAMTRQAPAR